MLALVLTAGGARGAYQAGVLKRVGEIPALRDAPSPFAIVAGASAGAINGAMIAAGSAQLRQATHVLAQLWAHLEVPQVFRTDAVSLARGGLGLFWDLALGGLLRRTVTQSLFDATPLYALIARTMPPEVSPTASARGTSSRSRSRRPAITRDARSPSCRADPATPYGRRAGAWSSRAR